MATSPPTQGPMTKPTSKAAERGSGEGGVTIQNDRSPDAKEGKLVRGFILASLAVHGGVFLFASLKYSPSSPLIQDEWVMDADLLSDVPTLAPAEANVQKAEVAPEVKVSEKLLPQLPKHVIPETAKPEETPVALEKAPEPPKPEKKEEAPSVPEEQPKPPPEVAKVEPPPPDPNKQTIDAEELEKRKKIEALQKAGQTAKNTEAPKANPKLADIIALANKQGGISGSGGKTASGSSQGYIEALKKMVRQRYHLPDVYNFGSAQIEAIYNIVLSEKGDLLQLELAKSSGDQVYDDLTKEAIKQATPFPPPPPDIVGSEIKLRFTP